MADDDPYVYPGTSVLRNRFGIRDAAELAELEAAISAGRIAQLERRFIPGDYDIAHLQAVHRKIFGDLYPWAGELRTVKIAKAESMFALPQHVAAYLTGVLNDLAGEDRLRGLERDKRSAPSRERHRRAANGGEGAALAARISTRLTPPS